ncbi:MAG: rod shape-determining protein MreC [Clostridiales bacterium]|jgi:rod shape-determining protein MreC|nr:rod shape-determining protein MreC [Clostridiales bacterium]
MKRKRSGLQPKFILLILTIICGVFIIFTYNSKGNFVSPFKTISGYTIVPMQKGIVLSGEWLKDKFDFIKNINKLKSENEDLQTRLYELEYENKILQLDKFELERLRGLFDLDQKYPDYPKVAARVIGKNPGNWYTSFTIDKGENDGLEIDMNVLAGNGLVGRIIEVGPTYSIVLSIIDDTSNVSSMFLRTSDLCIVRGDRSLLESGNLMVENINKNALVNDGEEIVTSMVSDKYLEGILIGYVKDIKIDPNNLTRSGLLEPVVDFKHLQEVLVITAIKEQ